MNKSGFKAKGASSFEAIVLHILWVFAVEMRAYDLYFIFFLTLMRSAPLVEYWLIGFFAPGTKLRNIHLI